MCENAVAKLITDQMKSLDHTLIAYGATTYRFFGVYFMRNLSTFQVLDICYTEKINVLLKYKNCMKIL